MSNDSTESLLPKQRLENLCDAIFAITMTLMIFELKTPQSIPRNLERSELPNALLSLIPSVEAYVISFIILGIFWLRHQIQFKYLESVNFTILFINIFILLLTGFVPFSVELLKEYPDYNLPFMIYSLNLCLISLLLLFQWYYISNHDKISNKILNPSISKKLLHLSLIPLGIFLASFIVSYFNVRYAFFIIYLVPLFYLIYNYYYNKKLRGQMLRQ